MRRRRTDKEGTDLSSIRDATASLWNLREVLGDSVSGKQIVWVDDEPNNNTIPRKVLENAGASILISQSTVEAVSIFEDKISAIDLVISDMRRGENSTAGLELLGSLRHVSQDLPAIIYSDSLEAATLQTEIERLGAIGPILGPKNLISVISHLLRKHAA